MSGSFSRVRTPHPLLSVWTKPGETIREIGETRPRRLFFPLAAVWGVSYNLALVLKLGVPSQILTGTSPWAILGLNAAIGAVLGVSVLWGLSYVVAWLSRLLGGTCDARRARTLLAWAAVPHIPNVLIATTTILVGGRVALEPHAVFGGSPILRPFQLTNPIFWIWSLIVGVLGLSAVAGINALRALGVLLLIGMGVMLLLLAMALIFAAPRLP